MANAIIVTTQAGEDFVLTVVFELVDILRICDESSSNHNVVYRALLQRICGSFRCESASTHNGFACDLADCAGSGKKCRITIVIRSDPPCARSIAPKINIKGSYTALFNIFVHVQPPIRMLCALHRRAKYRQAPC